MIVSFEYFHEENVHLSIAEQGEPTVGGLKFSMA